MKIVITGGTGTLGSALVRRLATDSSVERLVILSRDEVKQGNLSHELAVNGLDDNVRFFLGDVRDEQRLVEVFSGCDHVVHTAALKRVDRTAQDPEEVLKTNVLGTANVLRAALRAGIKKVLFISSDKAVMPTNFYGTTKQLGEQLTVSWNMYSYPKGMIAACVRYGNVIGSRGSVLEVWSDARRRRKQIMLTHENMTRFVITIEEAVEFVLTSLERMQGGEVFVPRLPSVRLSHIAHMFSESVQVIGLRPGGEKLHERLLSDEEPQRTLWQDDRFVVTPWSVPWTTLRFRGAHVPLPFNYSSDDPQDGFMVGDELRLLIEPWLVQS